MENTQQKINEFRAALSRLITWDTVARGSGKDLSIADWFLFADFVEEFGAGERFDMANNAQPKQSIKRLLVAGLLNQCGNSIALSPLGCAVIGIKYVRPKGYEPGPLDALFVDTVSSDW